MSAIVVFGLKNCDTCRKALAALEAAGRTVTFHDIRNDVDLATKVPRWLAAVGAETLVNRRSTTWRSLGEEERDKALSASAADVLISHPTLIKRPVVEAGDDVYVGWTKAAMTALT